MEGVVEGAKGGERGSGVGWKGDGEDNKGWEG